MSTVKAKKQQKKSKNKHKKHKPHTHGRQSDKLQTLTSTTDNQHHTSSTPTRQDVVSTDVKTQVRVQSNNQSEESNLIDIPIMYEDTTLFGNKAPLILLISVMMTLLTFAFLKHQYTVSTHTQRVTITTENSSTQSVNQSANQPLDKSSGKQINNSAADTAPQDVIMLKLKEPTADTK